jgi:hypothetical protein
MEVIFYEVNYEKIYDKVTRNGSCKSIVLIKRNAFIEDMHDNVVTNI